MENLLALDIDGTLLTGVLLDTSGRATIVRGYGITEIEDGAVDEALSEIFRQVNYREGECRISIGAENCFFRNLELPFRDRQKISQVLPFELEEITSHQMDQMHLGFLQHSRGQDNSAILALMVQRATMAELLAYLQAENLDPEIFAVSGLQSAAYASDLPVNAGDDFVLLDIGLQRATCILLQHNNITLIRSLSLVPANSGFSYDPNAISISTPEPERIHEFVTQLLLQVSQTLLPLGQGQLLDEGADLYLSGCVGMQQEVLQAITAELAATVKICNLADQPLLKIEPSDWPYDPSLWNTALALATYKGSGCQVVNLRSGDFRRRTSTKTIRRIGMAVALPVAALCLGLIGFSWWDYHSLEKKRDELNRQVVEVFQETLPEVNNVVKPLQQLRQKIDETRERYRTSSEGNGGLRQLELLTELSARIPKNLEIRISRLVADQDDVRMRGNTKDFNTVDNVKKELEKSDYFSSVVISSANLAPKGGEVRFELKLEYRN